MNRFMFCFVANIAEHESQGIFDKAVKIRVYMSRLGLLGRRMSTLGAPGEFGFAV